MTTKIRVICEDKIERVMTCYVFKEEYEYFRHGSELKGRISAFGTKISGYAVLNRREVGEPGEWTFHCNPNTSAQVLKELNASKERVELREAEREEHEKWIANKVRESEEAAEIAKIEGRRGLPVLNANDFK